MQKKIVSVLVAILPILTIYSTGIAGISLADLVLFLLCCYHFITSRKINLAKAALPLAVFVIYILLIGMISALIYSTGSINILIRTVRFTFYICCAGFITKQLDAGFLIKTVQIFTVICFFAITVQYIAYYTAGQYVNLFIPGIPLSFDAYEETLETSAYFRPAGLFGEPASLVWYILPILNYTLSKLGKEFTFKKLLYALVLSATVIMTKSLFGLLFLAILWVIWAVYFVTFRKNVKLPNLLMFIALPILAVYVLQTPVVQEALIRIDFSNLEGSGSFAGRFLQYDIYGSLNVFQKFFGVGIGNLMGAKSINNAVAYIITGSGIIGILLLAVFYIFQFKNAKPYVAKVLLLCTLVMSFGSNALLSTGIIYFFSFVRVCNLPEQEKKPANPVSEVTVK